MEPGWEEQREQASGQGHPAPRLSFRSFLGWNAKVSENSKHDPKRRWPNRFYVMSVNLIKTLKSLDLHYETSFRVNSCPGL